MNDGESHLHPWIEPELEARIIALVLGESSDFETEELERLIEEQPELAMFRNRMEAMHGLLHRAAKGEREDAGEEWKLPEDRRNAILAVIEGAVPEEEVTVTDAGADEGLDETETESPDTVVAVMPVPKSSKKRAKLNWIWLAGVSAAACLFLFFGLAAMMPGIADSERAPGTGMAFYREEETAEATKLSSSARRFAKAEDVPASPQMWGGETSDVAIVAMTDGAEGVANLADKLSTISLASVTESDAASSSLSKLQQTISPFPVTPAMPASFESGFDSPELPPDPGFQTRNIEVDLIGDVDVSDYRSRVAKNRRLAIPEAPGEAGGAELSFPNSGAVRATGGGRKGGRVTLGAPGGNIDNTGSIIARKASGAGGEILIDATGGDVRGSEEMGQPGSDSADQAKALTDGIIVTATNDVTSEADRRAYFKAPKQAEALVESEMEELEEELVVEQQQSPQPGQGQRQGNGQVSNTKGYAGLGMGEPKPGDGKPGTASPRFGINRSSVPAPVKVRPAGSRTPDENVGGVVSVDSSGIVSVNGINTAGGVISSTDGRGGMGGGGGAGGVVRVDGEKEAGGEGRKLAEVERKLGVLDEKKAPAPSAKPMPAPNPEPAQPTAPGAAAVADPSELTAAGNGGLIEVSGKSRLSVRKPSTMTIANGAILAVDPKAAVLIDPGDVVTGIADSANKGMNWDVDREAVAPADEMPGLAVATDSRNGKSGGEVAAATENLKRLSELESREQVPPVLGDVPMLGRMFRQGEGEESAGKPVDPVAEIAKLSDFSVATSGRKAGQPDDLGIDLNLEPEVVEFDGFINHGSPMVAGNRGMTERPADPGSDGNSDELYRRGEAKGRFLSRDSKDRDGDGFHDESARGFVGGVEGQAPAGATQRGSARQNMAQGWAYVPADKNLAVPGSNLETTLEQAPAKVKNSDRLQSKLEAGEVIIATESGDITFLNKGSDNGVEAKSKKKAAPQAAAKFVDAPPAPAAPAPAPAPVTYSAVMPSFDVNGGTIRAERPNGAGGEISQDAKTPPVAMNGPVPAESPTRFDSIAPENQKAGDEYFYEDFGNVEAGKASKLNRAKASDDDVVIDAPAGGNVIVGGGFQGKNLPLAKTTATAQAGENLSGTITGAAEEMRAHGNVHALRINNTGSIRANGAQRSGGQVVAGTVTGDSLDAIKDALRVTAIEDGATVEWEDFSISAGEISRISQPRSEGKRFESAVSGELAKDQSEFVREREAPIVVWADDETSKLNPNQAAGGATWAVPIPRGAILDRNGTEFLVDALPSDLQSELAETEMNLERGAGGDVDRRRFRSAQDEWQRYPGHPATTAARPTLSGGSDPAKGEVVLDMIRDTRDSLFLPRKGYRAASGVEQDLGEGEDQNGMVGWTNYSPLQNSEDSDKALQWRSQPGMIAGWTGEETDLKSFGYRDNSRADINVAATGGILQRGGGRHQGYTKFKGVGHGGTATSWGEEDRPRLELRSKTSGKWRESGGAVQGNPGFADGTMTFGEQWFTGAIDGGAINPFSITSRSGQREEVEVTREFLYPTEYDPPELPNTVDQQVRFSAEIGKAGDDGKSTYDFQRQARAKRVAPPSGLEEKNAAEESFSTFSLHVSDVSFKLAQAALAKGEWPEAGKVRIEEFVNALDYGDPNPSQDEKVACRVEQAIHPFLQQRNLMRVAMRTAAAGRAGDTPLRLTFLLDNSGSMERADREETVRRAFALLADQLQPIDQVTLISFARQPRLLADKVSGDKSGDLVEVVANLPSEGGTNLEAALKLAFEKAQEQKVDNAQNRIVLLTDGAANLGNAKPESLAAMIESMREEGIAFDAAGIGADGLNDEILEALTRKGDGRYYLLDRPEDADDGFARQIAGALRPAAKNVKVQVEFNPDRVGNYKLLGFEKHRLKKEDFRDDSVDAAEMAAEEAGVAVYQFEAKADGKGDVGFVSVRFRDMSSGKMVENRWPIPYEPSAPRPDQAAPSMQLATAAALLAAKLNGEPLGETVELDELARTVSSLPEAFQSKERVRQLRQMIEQARELAAK